MDPRNDFEVLTEGDPDWQWCIDNPRLSPTHPDDSPNDWEGLTVVVCDQDGRPALYWCDMGHLGNQLMPINGETRIEPYLFKSGKRAIKCRDRIAGEIKDPVNQTKHLFYSNHIQADDRLELSRRVKLAWYQREEKVKALDKHRQHTIGSRHFPGCPRQ